MCRRIGEEALRRSVAVTTAGRLGALDPAGPAADAIIVDSAGNDAPPAPWPGAPTLTLVPDGDRADRPSRAMRRSSSAREVVDLALRLGARRDATPPRILVVDDDPAVLEAVHALFAPIGVEVTRAGGALDALDLLDEPAHDLVILDLEMPALGGLELCRVMRAHPRWSLVPVLFLTAHGDRATLARVFAAGADDFVAKPIVGPELVARVGNRLERARMAAALAHTDALTGLANRRRSAETLEELVELSNRFQQPLCVAMLDVDRFKAVNDTHGHEAGDSVLRALGEHLRGSFGSGDLVGRWGGEEFIVGLFAASSREGAAAIVRSLDEFRATEIAVAGSSLRVSFSAGVAEYPRDGGDVPAVCRAADAALYRAKESGRARVQPATRTP